MNDLWLDRDRLKELTGWSDRTIFRKQKSGGGLRSRQRSESGRRTREYCVLSLPAEFQKKLADSFAAAATTEALSLVPSIHDKQISMFVRPPSVPEGQRIALTQEQREEADRRLSIIAPLQEFRRRTNGHRPVFRASNGQEIRSLDGLANYVAQQHGISRATIWRWDSRFQKFGYPALADDVRSDKGTSRFFERHPQLAKLVQAKYLAERLPIRSAYEALLRETSGDAPCYDTVREYLKSLPAAITIMGREGSKQFKERVEPFVQRRPELLRVNQVWISDHVQHDVWVRNVDLETGSPFFPGLAIDEPLRPWMTAWMDWRTRKIVGAVWCWKPSSHTISSALRVAITECGVPEEAYVDNGKDYRKLRAGAGHELRERDNPRVLSPECLGVLARLNIKTTNSLPYHAQSKPIESFFGNRLHKRFDKIWGDTYCGESPADRPEQCDEARKQHAQFMSGKRQASPLPAASYFVQMAIAFIQEYNSLLPHSGRGMNDRTPDEVFAEGASYIRKIDSTNKDALDQLFWHRDRRRVSEGGCVQIYNHRYEPADGESAAQLYQQIERDVLIACDPLSLGEAIAMDLDGRVIGRLRAQKLLAWGPVSRDEYVASLRERRHVAREVKNYISNLSRNIEPEVESMRRRNGIPAVIPRPAVHSGSSRMALPTRGSSAPAYVGEVVEHFFEDGD